ncbi:hypothetical protein ACN47E_000903 [Coniothyrium glycines]
MDMGGMTLSSSDAPASTMSGMAMASSTGTMDMASSTNMMGMNDMAMTFFTSMTTPLFSMAWTPKSTGQYAGTCIFLIGLAAIFRSLLALRLNLFRLVRTSRSLRKQDEMSRPSVVPQPGRRAWRAKEAVWLASIDVLLSGLAYLLMIAVMTMNVGYFLSVLGGTFIGSLVFGHFLAQTPMT